MTYLRRCAGLALVFLVVGAVGFGSAPTAPLPVVGVTAGPTWASQINTAIAELQTIVTPKLGNAQLDLGTDAELKHGTRTVRLGPVLAVATVGTPVITAIFGDAWTAAGAADRLVWSIPLADNDRILSVSVYGTVAVATAWTIELQQWSALTGGFVSIATASSTTSVGISKVTLSFSATSVVSPFYYQVRWVAGAVNNKVSAVEVAFDKIATP